MKKENGFVHLHVHSYSSLLDGFSNPEDIVKRAKELGQSAIALTDHGVMYSVPAFIKAGKKHGVKTIIGCEVYVASAGSMYDKVQRPDGYRDNHHLLLLAKNSKGYENLMKIVSLGFTDGFYRNPRVDLETLEKHSEGIICSSACLGGVVPQTLLRDAEDKETGQIDADVISDNYPLALEVARNYQRIFGKENYLIEIMDHGLEAQKATNPYLVKIANEIGAMVIATNDSHYSRPEDFEAYKTLVRMQTNTPIDQELRLGIPTNDAYLKSEREMLQAIPSEYHQAVHNTVKVAEMCNFELENDGKVKIPHYEAPDYFNEMLKEKYGLNKFNQMSPNEKNRLYLKHQSEIGLRNHVERIMKDAKRGIEAAYLFINKIGKMNYVRLLSDYLNNSTKYSLADEVKSPIIELAKLEDSDTDGLVVANYVVEKSLEFLKIIGSGKSNNEIIQNSGKIIQETKTVEEFNRLVAEGLNKLRDETPKKLKERMNYELSVIEKLGFTDYYLVVQDFVNWSLKNGISVGPGRGSGVGSLVAYYTNITSVDPIKYDLLFERFLNPDRLSAPDFDIDFPDDKRQEVIEYVRKKYGEDHVSMIVTFGTMGARGVIRDVARIYKQNGDRLAKMVPETPGIKLKDVLIEGSDLKKEYDANPESRKLLDMCLKLEGVPKNISTHASGVIIADKAVSDYVPLTVSTATDGTRNVSAQYNMIEVEELGLLKFDFLGLRTQSVISNTVDLIRQKGKMGIEGYNKDFDITKIPLNDRKTYRLINEGNTTGVFQLESDGMKATAKEVGVKSLEDIIALISLYRPGPMDNIPEYIFNKNNPREIKYGSDKMIPITENTYGILVYQEQILQTLSQIAGYTVAQADIVRIIMSKKYLDKMAIEKHNFVYGRDEKLGKYIKVDGELFEVRFDKELKVDRLPTYSIVDGVYKNTNIGSLGQSTNGKILDLKDYLNDNRVVKDEIPRYNKDGSENSEVEVLIPGAMRHSGLDELTAQKIINDIEAFASYAFNKSHAAAYSMNSYRSAFLKANYPLEFHSVLLTSVYGKTDQLRRYISTCKSETGIEIKGPDVNKSLDAFTDYEGSLIFGLSGLKHVGKSGVDIIEERDLNGEFVSIVDFVSRMAGRVNKRSFESLVKAGALDSFGFTRATLLKNVDVLMDISSKERKNQGRTSLISLLSKEDQERLNAVELDFVEEMKSSEILDGELEIAGLYLSGNPIENYSRAIKEAGVPYLHEVVSSINEEDGIYNIDDFLTIPCVITKFTVKSIKDGTSKMGLLEVMDQIESLPMIAWEKTLDKNEGKIEEGKVVMLNAKIQLGLNDELQLIAFDFTDIPDNSAPDSEFKGLYHKFNRGKEKPKRSYKKVKPSKKMDNIETVRSRRFSPGLYFNINDTSKYKQVIDILKVNQGSVPVYFVNKNANTKEARMFKLSDLMVNVENITNSTELTALLGENSMKLIQKY